MQVLNIFVPLDFSPFDEQALAFLEKLAVRERNGHNLELHVTLFHLVAPGALPTYDLHPDTLAHGIGDDDTRSRLQKLHQAQTRLQQSGLSVHSKIAPRQKGPVGRSIAHHAARHGAHLILAMSKHREGVRGWLAHTALPAILRNATVPVFCLSPGKLPSIQRVLFATDFGTHAAHIVARLQPLVQFFGAGLYLAKVSSRDDYETTRTFRAHCREFNDALAAQSLDLMSTINTYIHYQADDRASGIVQCAEDHLADLVVVATRGLSGFKLWLEGSLTDELLETTTLPLLVYRLPETE
jgi:nucleotide-binding universal stress UspA family protein